MVLFALVIRSSTGLRPAKPSLTPCQWVIALLAQFPTEQDDLTIHFAGEIEQADVEVLDLNANGVDLSHRVLNALQCFVAVCLAGGKMNDVQRHAASEINLVGKRLKFCLYAFDQVLGFDGGAQQGFKDGQQV